MLSYSFLIDRLPAPADLRLAIAEVFAVDPAQVHIGRLYEDDGGPPATVSCTYLPLDGGDFPYRLDIGADDTVPGPTEPATATALARRFTLRALLSLNTPTDEYWRLITPTEDHQVPLDLTRLDQDHYVLATNA
ncbi:hypothetical protein [Actinokineospora cianjurensis]|uniref:Uncharacterized protein n=1 Tax=Actinokineospora cianjurensis TaxID=585224 RepID=A0A421B1J6_9PSEU|nr:hypothetical protein [Actinokineospora cianjurensis]RLK58156.1 hypothetical protein CLV68_4250 [Actinokineospora cianjurensis]